MTRLSPSCRVKTRAEPSGSHAGDRVIEPVIGEAGEPSVECDRVQVGPLVEPLVALALVRDEGDGRSVGTPGQVGGVDAERSEFPRGSSGGRKQVDLARSGGRRIAGIGEIAPPVEPVVHPFRGPAGEPFLELALLGRQAPALVPRSGGVARVNAIHCPSGTPHRRFGEARNPERSLIQSIHPHEHGRRRTPRKAACCRDSSADRWRCRCVSESRRAGRRSIERTPARARYVAGSRFPPCSRAGMRPSAHPEKSRGCSPTRDGSSRRARAAAAERLPAASCQRPAEREQERSQHLSRLTSLRLYGPATAHAHAHGSRLTAHGVVGFDVK